ncbi:MAG TPA: universal stress protein [Rubrivivax sp.]|nr:universal stress protein [Rubrivivax sp.]
MSDIRQILALVNDSPRSDRVLALAAHLARSHGAALAALHAVEPLRSGAFISAEAASVAASWATEAEAQRWNETTARVAAAAAAAGMAIPLVALRGETVSDTLRHAASADLLVLSQRSPGLADGAQRHYVERLLVGTGTPLLFVPHADTLPLHEDGAPRCGRRVLVAWSASRESVRALRDALPLLARAEQVELVRFLPAGEPAAESLDALVGWLRRHGVSATSTVRHAPSPSLGERLLSTWTVDVPIAEALLSHAADTDADLLVMGGYGHPRAWEMTLGGVTRTILQTMTLPVLMSH